MYVVCNTLGTEVFSVNDTVHCCIAFYSSEYNIHTYIHVYVYYTCTYEKLQRERKESGKERKVKKERNT